MRKRFVWLLAPVSGLLVSLVVACTAPVPPGLQAQSSACPVNFRQDLVPKWLTCSDGKADVKWPPNDGFDGQPVAEALPVGGLIDRFGSEGGTFFSPKGQNFHARAVPYVCTRMDYRVYRVMKPIEVKLGRAAGWFDEPGGAVQYETSEPAYKLVASGSLALVDYDPAGSGTPAEPCRGS